MTYGALIAFLDYDVNLELETTCQLQMVIKEDRKSPELPMTTKLPLDQGMSSSRFLSDKRIVNLCLV